MRPRECVDARWLLSLLRRVASAVVAPAGRWLTGRPIKTSLRSKVAPALKPAARAVTMCVVSDELEPTSGAEEDEEEVDGLPVLAEVRPIEPAVTAAPAPLPAVQAAAVAATGFVAGAATVALVMRRNARRVGRLPALPRPNGDDGALPGVRTFLVHVHVLGRPGEN